MTQHPLGRACSSFERPLQRDVLTSESPWGHPSEQTAGGQGTAVSPAPAQGTEAGATVALATAAVRFPRVCWSPRRLYTGCWFSDEQVGMQDAALPASWRFSMWEDPQQRPREPASPRAVCVSVLRVEILLLESPSLSRPAGWPSSWHLCPAWWFRFPVLTSHGSSRTRGARPRGRQKFRAAEAQCGWKGRPGPAVQQPRTSGTRRPVLVRGPHPRD